MAGWLLWMVKHPSPLWTSYLALLPTEAEMSCLLNFSPAEAEQLQVPRLQVCAAAQRTRHSLQQGSLHRQRSAGGHCFPLTTSHRRLHPVDASAHTMPDSNYLHHAARSRMRM
jgi:hypothetical protein